MDMLAIRLMQVLIFLGAGFAIVVWLAMLKRKYQKIVIGKVLCRFQTREGNIYTKLLSVDGGTVTLPPTKKIDGKSYAIADIACGLVDYPAGRPAFLQSKVKEAWFDEDSYEPVSNRCGKLLLDPRRLYNLINQRFTQIGLEQAREESTGKLSQQKSGSSLMWVIIALVAMALIGGAVYFLNQFDLLKAAAGVG